MNVKVLYSITEDCRRRMFAEAGEYPAEKQTVEIDISQATRVQREIILRCIDSGIDPVVRITGFADIYSNRSQRKIVNDPSVQYRLDHLITDLFDLVEACADMSARREKSLAASDEKDRQYLNQKADRLTSTLRMMIDKHDDNDCREGFSQCEINQCAEFCIDLSGYRAVRSEYDAVKQSFREERIAREIAEDRRKDAIKAAKEAEKRDWVMAHGSAHLKRCVEAGYNCQRLYLEELAALEYPGYTLDFNGNADWKSRSCPSPAAMDEAERVDGEVVWLICPPSTIEDFEPCEAVLVEYIDQHSLIRII